MDGADLDALLEAKYEHDLDEELLGQLQEEEEGNDETFGSLSEPVGKFQSPLSAFLPRFCKTSKGILFLLLSNLDKDFDFTASKPTIPPAGQAPRARPTESQVNN